MVIVLARGKNTDIPLINSVPHSSMSPAGVAAGESSARLLVMEPDCNGPILIFVAIVEYQETTRNRTEPFQKHIVFIVPLK